MSFEIELHVDQGEVYELLWTVPDVSVVNVFVDPDGSEQAFPHPGRRPSEKDPSRIEIRAKYGIREQFVEAKAFGKNRTPPEAERFDDPIEGMELKHFKARFKAHRPGIARFEVRGGPQDISWIRTMKIERVPRQYNTIEEVANDRSAVRRHAVLADIYDFFPAYNKTSGLVSGQPSNIPGQGDWKGEYDFDTSKPGTSCTTVNPRMMGGLAANDSTKWSFNAGPHHEEGKNPAWVGASATKMPSVGDTYIVFNLYTYGYGHVGIILHRPPDGNGLWITADGGQGSKKDGQQLGLFVPRWGIMGEHLPSRGIVEGMTGNYYKGMKPEPDGAVFLSGAMKVDIRHEDKSLIPPQQGDAEAVKRWLKFYHSTSEEEVSNPRRLHGFVDVDDVENLVFEADKREYSQANVDKCGLLAKKVAKVIDVAMAGKTLVAGT